MKSSKIFFIFKVSLQEEDDWRALRRLGNFMALNKYTQQFLCVDAGYTFKYISEDCFP